MYVELFGFDYCIGLRISNRGGGKRWERMRMHFRRRKIATFERRHLTWCSEHFELCLSSRFLGDGVSASHGAHLRAGRGARIFPLRDLVTVRSGHCAIKIPASLLHCTKLLTLRLLVEQKSLWQVRFSF